MKRYATAVWKGAIKEGNGSLTTQSTILNDTQYSFGSRFAEGKGTNPEELLAAAHAGCFAMKLSASLGEAGFTADKLEAKAQINLNVELGKIDKSHITLTAKIPDISKQQFDACVKDAEENCPVSKLFNAEITVDATLE